MCRCLTTQVVDEEEVYKERNTQLDKERKNTEHRLFALNEKLAVFNDLKAEVEQLRADGKNNDEARNALWAKIEALNGQHAKDMDDSAARNRALVDETAHLRAEIEACKQRCANKLGVKQQENENLVQDLTIVRVNCNNEVKASADAWLKERQDLLD